MIRINLVAEGRRPVVAGPAKRAPESSLNERLGPLLLLVLPVVGLLGFGVYWWVLSGRVAAKTEQVAEAQAEVDELAPIIAEVEAFKAKKLDLETKVRVITDLKRNQHGPVRIMDAVSSSVPDLLWLTKLEVRPQTLNVTGQALNTNAVANFIENLDGVPEFSEPILRNTERRNNRYTFALDFGYSFVDPAGDEASAGGG